MKRIAVITMFLGMAVSVTPSNAAEVPGSVAEEGNESVNATVKSLLADYQTKFAELELVATKASWASATTGKKEDFDSYAKASLALRKFHSDPDTYKKIERLLQTPSSSNTAELAPIDARALHVAYLAFKANQLPGDLLKQMVDLSTDIEQGFKTFRAEIDGKRMTNNDLLEMIRKEKNSKRREQIWGALKQVGGAVGGKLVALAKLRNRAAQKLGYTDYWDMQIRLQEHDPKQLLAIFGELEKLTTEPFGKMKRQLDGELARRFEIRPEQMMPWHYDNPFFQAAPPSEKVNLDEFYRDKTKEEITELARKFFVELGLPIDEIIARSDLYDREGKDQHAFCTSIDRAGDVRTLCNIQPTAEWMDTMLHEQGHAVYDVHVDRSLPFNLRAPSHAFTTEGIAMLLGALARNPKWMVKHAGADRKRVREVAEAVMDQRRREQLIFARWTMVMLNFEKALYEDPDRDLNTLWWDYVERFQLVNRPPDRNQPDWAAKPHFTIAPIYYHNYMLGELFAAQLRHMLAEKAGYEGPTAAFCLPGRPAFGRLLKQKVFRPGDSMPWPEFVRSVTGEELTAQYFAGEVR